MTATTAQGGAMQIKCHRGYLDIEPVRGLVEIAIREDVDGPTVGSVSLDADAPEVVDAISMANNAAARQREEIRVRTDRAMTALCADAGDYESLRARLAELVECGLVDVSESLVRAEQFRATEIGQTGQDDMPACGVPDCDPEYHRTH